MPTIGQIVKRRDEILAAASFHGASNVRVFGSVARDEAGPQSDLDVLVRMDEGRSLLDRIALMQDLEDMFRVPVDVVNERAMPATIRDRVEQEAVPL